MPDDESGSVATTQDAEATNADGTTTDTTAEETTEDTTALKAALTKERDASKAAAKENRALKARLTELENAGKSDAERLATENEALKAQLADVTGKVRQAAAQEAVLSQSRKLGSPKPDLVWRLVRHDLEYDDDGAITNLDAVMKDAKAEAPELFRANGNADGGAGAGAANGGSDWLRQAFETRR